MPKTGVEQRMSSSTVRHQLRQELIPGFASVRELSSRIGVSERDVVHHLEHMEQSIRHQGERLEIEPAVCLTCGFTFQKRSKLTRPSSCPRCKGERIEAPRFRVHAGAARGPSVRRARKRGRRPDWEDESWAV